MRYTDSFIRKFLSKEHKINKKWRALAGIMAIIVTFTVTYSLILPAITVSRDQADEIAGLYLDDAEEAFDIVEDDGDEDELWSSEGDVIQHTGVLEDDWDGILIEEETEDESEEIGSGIELEEPAQSENIDAHYAYEQGLSSETEAETTAAIELDSEDKEETETESQTEISVETESETEVETKSENEVETESETEVETESETESETEIETETESVTRFPAQRFTASEDGVLIIVNAPESAFPEGTTMTVSHVDDEQTLKGIEEAAQTDEKLISRIEAVDICFRDADGNEIEPKAPVSVCMITENKASKEDPVVVHVDDDGHAETVQDAEVYTTGTHDQIVLTANGSAANQAEAETEAATEAIDESSAAAAKTAIEFETEQFSIYAVVYTVDFHWEVDGKMFEFSIPGGGFVSFTDLVEVLGITGDTNSDKSSDKNGAVIAENVGDNAASEEAEEEGVNSCPNKSLTLCDVEVSEATRKFVTHVESVEFSSPELVDVSKVDADTTVGQIKENRGLECEYSATLTEEQIAESNAQTVGAGDWALISVHPFTSEETMVVTMKDGEVFTVKVTDAQIKKTVIDAKGDTWEITVTYGEDAQIPEGTELKVIEYSKEDFVFDRCFADREKWAADITESSENSNQKDGTTTDIDNLTFEPGFSETVNYDIDGDLSDKDKAEAASLIQFSGTSVISGYILFDISLVYNGTEIEPSAPVQVTIQSTNSDLKEYDEISVGHFVENTTGITQELFMETIDDIAFSSDDSKANYQLIVDFETSSFSLYDVAGIQWTANESKTVYFALKAGINQILDVDQHGAIPIQYSDIENMSGTAAASYIQGLDDYQSAEPIVIYNKSGDSFYAIDGDGNLAQVYESGDTVMWSSQPSIGWKLIRYMNDDGEYTGYYDFINMETGKFLTPTSTSTIGTNRSSVQLDGAGLYSTTIKSWDNSVNAYVGYSINNGQLTTNASDEWYFAAVSQTVADDLKLQTVDTVDSRSLGVTIKMFDYDNTCNKNNRSQEQTSYQIFNSDGRDWLDDGSVIQGLVQNKLNSEGYPVTTYANTNLKGLFSNGTDANKLFMLDTYQETGYFEYSSFQNFAHLNSNGDFTVYRQVGVEDTAKTPGNKTYGNARGTYYFNRGNFLPYNTIADYKTAVQKYGSSGVTNRYDENGNLLDGDDPRNGENLFLTQETVDYFFGMSMEADFYQPAGGKNNGQDIIYEFNGDDDLWVFVDNVLVLDIGGCHHAHSGTINFTTGTVEVVTGNGISETTIRQCFKNAGIFPDGTVWVESKADQYFSGDTFADYSQHNMKMFYMERGAGASNLHIKFNLPVIKDAGKLIVDKVVSGTVNQKYSNDKFPFQVIGVNGNTETRFTSAVYESNGQPVEYAHEAVIDGVTYNDVFYLRPGEAALFDVADNSQQYYVKELGIDTSYYDRVLINREEATISNGIATSSVSTVKNRNRVTYDNHGITEDLRIKKIVEGDVKNSEDTFEFYVYLTGPNNELIPYSSGEYYVLDPDGNYCTYVNGLPVGDSSITEETRTAYESGQWGTIGSIPDGYTVLIPDLLVGTGFMVSERVDKIPAGYELKSIDVVEGTADNVSITDYTNVSVGDADSITVGTYTYTNHCEGKLKKDGTTDATVAVTNRAANKLIINKTWQTNDYVSEHGPVQFALFKLVDGSEVLVDDSIKTLTAPNLSIEYQIVGNVAEYVVREVVVVAEGNERTVTPVENNGVIEVSGETTTLGTDKTDTYIVTYQHGETTGTSRTDTVTNMMPKLTVNKKDISGNQLANAEFKLTGDDGETALTGYESLESNNKTSGNLLDGIYLSNGTYYLVESKAPNGYNALEYKIKIVVSGEVSRVFTASTVPESTTLIPDQTPTNNMLYTFNIYNNPGVVLPSTGGPGTSLHYLLGIMLTAFASLGLVMRKRRRVL